MSAKLKKCLITGVAASTALLVTCLAVFPLFGGAEEHPAPRADKTIDLVVHFEADVSIDKRAYLETSLAHEVVVPWLTSRGYTVRKAYSMHELIIENGGAYRSLLNAMAQEGKADTSRLLTVTVAALPGTEPGTVISQVALVDSYLSQMQKAFTLHQAPNTQLIWVYESRPALMGGENGVAALGQQVTSGLRTYDLQFQDKIRSRQYPDLPGLK